MRALIYLVLMFLSIALDLYAMGAHFVAALEVIIYAGAIMILFVFAVMLLNIGRETERREQEWLRGPFWVIPVILASALLALTVYAITEREGAATPLHPVPPRAVGIALFGPYILGVELASMLLLAGLVSAYHFGIFTPGGGSARDRAGEARKEGEDAPRGADIP